jgi:hypothetical protein
MNWMFDDMSAVQSGFAVHESLKASAAAALVVAAVVPSPAAAMGTADTVAPAAASDAPSRAVQTSAGASREVLLRQRLLEHGRRRSLLAAEADGSSSAEGLPGAGRWDTTLGMLDLEVTRPFSGFEVEGECRPPAALAESAIIGARKSGDPVDGRWLQGELCFIYRYMLRESCSQFDSLPLTYLTISRRRTD